MWCNIVIFLLLLSQAFGQSVANTGKWHLNLQDIRNVIWNSEGWTWLLSPCFIPFLYPLPLSNLQLTAQFLYEQSELSLIFIILMTKFTTYELPHKKVLVNCCCEKKNLKYIYAKIRVHTYIPTYIHIYAYVRVLQDDNRTRSLSPIIT
jgi:hypothetical protein